MWLNARNSIDESKSDSRLCSESFSQKKQRKWKETQCCEIDNHSMSFHLTESSDINFALHALMLSIFHVLLHIFAVCVSVKRRETNQANMLLIAEREAWSRRKRTKKKKSSINFQWLNQSIPTCSELWHDLTWLEFNGTINKPPVILCIFSQTHTRTHTESKPRSPHRTALFISYAYDVHFLSQFSILQKTILVLYLAMCAQVFSKCNK